MQRLPMIPITTVDMAWIIPVESNLRTGNKNLDSIVNIGWKT